MKLTKRKKRSCYVKLFKMFESELKNYDELFKDDNYILNYIVCRDYFGGEDEIRILFKIKDVRIQKSDIRNQMLEYS